MLKQHQTLGMQTNSLADLCHFLFCLENKSKDLKGLKLLILGWRHHTRGNFFFKSRHDYLLSVRGSTTVVCIHKKRFHFIPECFSSLLSRVWCLSWGLGECCSGVCENASFLFSCSSLALWASETADLQIYHVNEEGI